MPRKLKLLISILVSIFLLSGCSKTFSERFIIEQNGEIHTIYFSEFNGVKTIPPITESTLAEDVEYMSLPNIFTENEVFNINRQIAIDNLGVVNSNIYNFLIVLPIKSKKNIFELPTSPTQESVVNYFLTEQCQPPSTMSRFVYFLPSREAEQDEDGFYHYKLYVESNKMAANFLLNNISDLCVEYTDVYGGALGMDKYDIASNKIVIAAQEIKDMLDELGVSHE